MEEGGDRMIYVLVVVSYFSGAGGQGQTVSFQEFNSRDACEIAQAFLRENKYSRYSHDHYKTACIHKGHSQ
jgi:hypothetical protein